MIMAIVNPIEECADTITLTEQLKNRFDLSFQTISDLKEFFCLLSDSSFICDYIAIDLQQLYSIINVDVFAALNTISTLLNCTLVKNENDILVSRNTKIIVLVGTKTPTELIKEILNLPMISYIGLRYGDGFTVEEIIESVQNILNNDSTLPHQVNAMLSSKRKTSKTKNSINLTPRQRQIFNLVANRGASNKVIAKMLNISESTVKLHMGALLKKYKVRNRTQLAVFAKDNNEVAINK